MRLNEFDPKDIDVRVDCAGKQYPGTAEASNCLEEIRDLRKENGKDKDDAHAFNAVFERFMNEKPPNNAVESMLAGFGFTTAEETAQHRLERFKEKLEIEKSNQNLRDVGRSVKRWIGY